VLLFDYFANSLWLTCPLYKGLKRDIDTDFENVPVSMLFISIFTNSSVFGMAAPFFCLHSFREPPLYPQEPVFLSASFHCSPEHLAGLQLRYPHGGK
jgi:hypothetical protein